LVRTKAQTRAFEKSLLRAGIKYNLVGAASFASRTEVKDALSYLRLLLNPAAEFDLRRAAAVPRRKLGAAALDAFLAAAKRSDLPPGLALLDEATIASLPSRSRPGLLEFSATMSALAEQVPHGPAACVKFVLDAGLRSFYAAEPERLENLDELLAAAYSHEAEMGSGTSTPSGQEMLERFVENMSLASASDTTESSQVSVITAHASKGREFDHVWVVGAEEMIFPHSMSLDSPAEIDEERRLFFVAVSRARLGLTISYRRRHFVLGDWSDAEPSRFIEFLEPLTSGPQPAVEFIYPQAPNARFTNHRPTRPRRTWNPPTKSPVTAAAPPSPRLDPSQVSPGTSVDHSVFGPGTVLSLAGTLASIDFSGKVRVLDLSFAPLQPR
jgi:DNA helicase-2/ATP-dependent DNA helicase PcrA